MKKIRKIYDYIKYYPYRDEKYYNMFHTSFDDLLKVFVFIILILFILSSFNY